MTTSNLNQDALNDALNAARIAADDARARREAARREALNIEQRRTADRDSFRIAGRAVDQRHQDNLATVGEEIGQLNGIFDEPAPAPPAEPAPTTTQVIPVVPQPAPTAPTRVGVVARIRRAIDAVNKPELILAALVGAILGFLLGFNTRGWTGDRDWFEILWTVFFTLLGLGLFGWIDILSQKSRHNQQS